MVHADKIAGINKDHFFKMVRGGAVEPLALVVDASGPSFANRQRRLCSLPRVGLPSG